MVELVLRCWLSQKIWIRRKKSGITTSKSRHKSRVNRMKTEHLYMKFCFKYLNFIIPIVRIYAIIPDMKEICFKRNFFAAFWASFITLNIVIYGKSRESGIAVTMVFILLKFRHFSVIKRPSFTGFTEKSTVKSVNYVSMTPK